MSWVQKSLTSIIGLLFNGYVILPPTFNFILDICTIQKVQTPIMATQKIISEDDLAISDLCNHVLVGEIFQTHVLIVRYRVLTAGADTKFYIKASLISLLVGIIVVLVKFCSQVARFGLILVLLAFYHHRYKKLPVENVYLYT
jgi:hypothetical protein